MSLSTMPTGLSSYAKNPPDVRVSIQDLLAFIRETVPESQWAVTPIHLQVSGSGARGEWTEDATSYEQFVSDARALNLARGSLLLRPRPVCVP
jgi:Golgi nucleoside diphosphatase